MNRKPTELKQVAPGVEVAKDPAVLSGRVELAPVASFAPVPGLAGMGALGVSYLSVKHPGVELLECLGCHANAKVVCPAADDGVDAPDDHLYVGALAGSPFLA